MSKIRALVVAFVGAVTLTLVWYFSESPQPYTGTPFQVLRVAHAGGGLDGATYLNSYSALNANTDRGFRYFEVDFSFSRDHQVLCLHDWGKGFVRAFGYPVAEALTLGEFEELVASRVRGKTGTNQDKCTLRGLANWMEQNPGVKIVTDFKERNSDGLKMILETLPQARSRVIPQVYQAENFAEIKALGFEQMIWSLYRLSKQDKRHVLRWVQTFEGPFAITMTQKWAKTGLAKTLKKLTIPSYVHTINDSARAQRYMTELGVTEIYTDFLAPN